MLVPSLENREKAKETFDELSVQDVVSWTSLISGYAKYEDGESALECFEQMQLKGVYPNSVTYVCCLTACGKTAALAKGCEIHAEILKKGLLESEIAIGNALIDMYANCGMLAKAQQVFDVISSRDAITWNALMSGYVRCEYAEDAFECFLLMQLEGVAPDVSTLVCAIKACACMGDVDKGSKLHVEISRRGFSENNLVVGSALIDMYSKCSHLVKAREVFDELSVHDVISWNTLISGYTECEYSREAMNCFDQMQDDGISPDAITYVCILKACSSIGDIEKGREIHVEIAKQGLLVTDLVLGSALVDMYAKCGLLQHAQDVFDKLSVQDIVSWTALIAGYANHEYGKEALNCFDKMQFAGFSPNAVTYICSLKACATIGATEKCHEIHADVARKIALETNISVGCALVDTYGKSGFLTKAREVFDMLSFRDVNSWNALISGYARFNSGVEALKCFEHMQQEAVLPDAGTFVSVLVACCHGGLLGKGQIYFEIMCGDHRISPTVEHHSCMVSLLVRGGDLEMALALAAEMPYDSHLLVSDAMLNACRKWGNMDLGKMVFEHGV